MYTYTPSTYTAVEETPRICKVIRYTLSVGVSLQHRDFTATSLPHRLDRIPIALRRPLIDINDLHLIIYSI